MTGTPAAASSAVDTKTEDTATTLETAAVVEDANAAPSSSADAKDAKDGPAAVEGPKSVLDAVTAALAPDTKADDTGADAAGKSSEPKDGQDQPAAAAAEDGKTVEADDDSKLPFHNHPRWKEVIAERDSLKAPADQYQRIQQFMDHNGLTGSEVVEGFKIMALMKSDPVKAVADLQARIEALRELTGEKLPEDLQAKVDGGHITEEDAAELSKTRAANRRLADRVNQTDEERAAEQTATVKADVTNAIVGWEAQVKERDPDYANKQRRVLDRVRVIAMEEGGPRNRVEAVALANRAYKEVNDELAPLLPKRTTLARNPSSGIPSAHVVAAPKTMLDAVSLGLSKAAG